MGVVTEHERHAVSVPDRWTDAHRVLGWAIVAVGVALRLREYLADRSLWRDEAMLVFNLRHRDALGFTTPLDHNQGTPPGFFVIEQAVGSLGGQSELAYRFVPFIAAVGVLVLAMVLVRRHLEPAAGLVALALVAVSSGLVYFAAEVKPYELDVLVALAIWLAVSVTFERDVDGGSSAALAVVGAVGLVLSFTAVFVLAGAGLVLLVDRWRRRDARAVARLAAVGGCWVLVLLVVVLSSGRELGDNRFLSTFFAEGFLPLPPTDGDGLRRWGHAFESYFTQIGPTAAMWLLAPLAVVGLVVLARRQRTLLAVIASPWVLVVVASAFEVYPAVERVVLFVVPLVATLVGVGGAEVAAAVRARSDLLATGVLVCVVVVGGSLSLQRFTDPLELEELRPLVARVAEEGGPDDTVFVSAIAETAFDYYAAREHFAPAEIVVGSTEPDAISAQVHALAGRARVWVVVAAWWRGAEELDRVVTDAFDRAGTRVAELHETGAAVYLYDLG